MKSLNLPTLNPLICFDTFINGKKEPHRQRLKDLSIRIKDRYNQYELVAPRFEDLSHEIYSKEERRSLHSCYESNTNALKDLKSNIHSGIYKDNLSSSNRCKYCGLNHLANTFDHFLPKEAYPEFSVHPHNLIPCCNQCNQLKASNIKNSDGERLFLHLYFDDIPEEQFIFVKVIIENDLPIAKFFTNFPTSFSVYTKKLISNHINSLNLLKRYQVEASEVLSNILLQIKAHPNLFQEEKDVQSFYEREVKLLVQNLSYNHYKAIIYNQLVNDIDTTKIFLNRNFF